MLSQDRIARWWSLPVGLLLLTLGILIQAPFIVNELIDSLPFCLAGILFAILPWRERSVRMRAWAVALGVAGCAGRALTLILDPPGVTRFEFTRAVLYGAFAITLATTSILSLSEQSRKKN